MPRARRFWEGLGCEVVEQNAEAHDRVMARTHTLAFFVAKAMLDIGAGDEGPFTPPSFRAMAHTIAAVREDAAHLFRTIQVDNPFAAGERERLLQVMKRVHEGLLAVRSTAGEAPRSLDVPALGDRAPDLRETRELIDDLDRDLVDLLARRAQLARRAGRAKTMTGQPMRDPERERELLETRRAWAQRHGLESEGVVAVFASILDLSRSVQVLADGEER